MQKCQHINLTCASHKRCSLTFSHAHDIKEKISENPRSEKQSKRNSAEKGGEDKVEVEIHKGAASSEYLMNGEVFVSNNAEWWVVIGESTFFGMLRERLHSLANQTDPIHLFGAKINQY
jgi:hypothetical protein